MNLIGDKYEFQGGISPLDLCEQYGTPLYVYDADRMEKQYKRLSKAFSKLPNFGLHYACKALTNINVMRLFKNLGAGVDCVSIPEVELALYAGFLPEEILFTPNFASFDEMSKAVSLGVQINIDSIPMLEHWGVHFRDKPICIRINPHLMAGGNEKISVGHIDSKFGISIHQLPHALRVIKSQKLTVEGLHMHTGSDILDVGVFLLGSEILFSAAEKFPDLKYIDLGSGFKVPYKENDIETNVEELGEKLSARFLEFCSEYGRDLRLLFEPGKFLVSEAGYLFGKCTQVKQTTSTVFAGLDTGFNHLIRPMMYGAYHKIENMSKPNQNPRLYTVVGNICETDTFAVDRRLSEVAEGDILCFYNAGAYGWMMSSNYNSRFRPAEIMIQGGEVHLIRRRETMEDLLAGQLELTMA